MFPKAFSKLWQMHSSLTKLNVPTFSTSLAQQVRQPTRSAAVLRRSKLDLLCRAFWTPLSLPRHGSEMDGVTFLAANRLGYALYAPMFESPTRPANTARFTFLDARATDFFREWEKVANDTVGLLRAEAGRNPYDRGLTDLIGELSTRSEEFRIRWAAHNVRFHNTGTKELHHPAVGDLELTYESLELTADPGLTMHVYTAPKGSATQDSLNLLATWSATLDQIDVAEAPEAFQLPRTVAGSDSSY